MTSSAQSHIPRPFSIDTRTLQPGDFFVALDGTRQKGYTFLTEAFRKGAAAALAARVYETEARSILPASEFAKVQFTADPAETMAVLAHAARKKYSVPVVGIAGSVGKTSTKEFLAFLLARKYSVLSTQGNLNNYLGLPMMLSRLAPEHQMAVLEMGADHVGDLAALVRIAEPTHGLLTPIAPEHLSGFGSMGNVYAGELELLQSPQMKCLVTAADDSELDQRLNTANLKIIRAGFSKTADVRIENVRIEGQKTYFTVQGRPVILPSAASFMALNAGLAAAMAVELGLSWEEIAGEWNVPLPPGRFTICPLANGLTVIDDTYNSSPRAFSAAVQTFDKMATGRKWLVFSDMLELGAESAQWHAEAGTVIGNSRIEKIFAFGHESRAAIDCANQVRPGAGAKHFESAEQLCAALVSELRSGDWVLLKGSRGMRVERVLDHLKNKF